MKIYISSTQDDLKESRQVIYRTLRQMRHDAIAMEDYISTGQYPLNRCLSDVAGCELYIGIFAWRYGYIPKEENPDQKSITELEYCKAVEEGKICLFFLLKDTAPWPPSRMDAITGHGEHGTKIAKLRSELASKTEVNFFETTDQLIGLICLSIYQWEKSRSIGSISQSSNSVKAENSQDTTSKKDALEETEKNSDDLLSVLGKYHEDIAPTLDALKQISDQINKGDNISLNQLSPIINFLRKTSKIAQEFFNLVTRVTGQSREINPFRYSLEPALNRCNDLAKELSRLIASYIVLFGASKQLFPQHLEIQRNFDLLRQNINQVDMLFMDGLGKLIRWLVGQTEELILLNPDLPPTKIVNSAVLQEKEKIQACKAKLQQVHNNLQHSVDSRSINRKDLEVFRRELGEAVQEVRSLVDVSTTGTSEMTLIVLPSKFLRSAEIVYQDIKQAMNELALALDIMDRLEEGGSSTIARNIFGMSINMKRFYYDCLNRCLEYLHDALQEFLV